MNDNNYPIELRPLAADEGGGWLASFPDLPGCMADGETPEKAMREARDAAKSWLAMAREFGDAIPAPGSGGESGKFMTRVPRSLHTRLVARAKAEGVSMNTLVVALLSEGAGAGIKAH